MILTGLTGSLGSGKTTVGRLLEQRGAAVIDADALVRAMQEPGRLLHQRLAREFGAQILQPGGALDRAAVAKRVFDDPVALRRLNGLVHPAVRRQEAALIACWSDWPVVVLDIPLLFENHLHRLLDWVIVVTVDEAGRTKRLKKQRGMDEAEIRRRLGAQWPEGRKRALAHFTIDNSGSLARTEAQVEALWRRLHGMNRTICKMQKQNLQHNPFISH